MLEYGALDTELLVRLEEGIGTVLPEDYRAFLVATNGGRPAREEVALGGTEGSTLLHTFYGLHAGPEHARLDTNLQWLNGRIPTGLLPIAGDQVGNVFCLGLFGSSRGMVFFWDHELEGTSPSAELPAVARCFAEFLNSLS
jgi:hypothetical protein